VLASLGWRLAMSRDDAIATDRRDAKLAAAAAVA